MRDLYEVLGVEKDATPSQVKRSYHKLALKYHPDQNPGDAEAEEKFKEASNAYAVLSDQEKRARYDQYGHDGLRGHGGFSNSDDIFSAFGDLFSDFFGRRRGPAPGDNLKVGLKLSFAEAVWGTDKEVEVSRTIACNTCDGSGAKKGTSPVACTTCKGQGQVLHSQGFFMVQTACPACRGRGSVIKSPCKECRGKGTAQDTSSLSVTVPAGVDNGQTLRLAGKGEASADGGQAGHLYVVMEVASDDRFERHEEDVLTRVPITYLQAALGSKVEIPTLEDDCEGVEEITVKAGTQPGDTMIRRGQGIPRIQRRGRGDQVLQFVVQIPKKLSRREKELLEQIADENS